MNREEKKKELEELNPEPLKLKIKARGLRAQKREM